MLQAKKQARPQGRLAALDFHDAKGCLRAIRTGGWAGLLLGAFNAAPHIYAYYLFSNGQLLGFTWQPIPIVECGLIISLSLLTLWKNRTAATLLFGYYIASRIFLFFHQDHLSMGLLFVMFIGAAIFFYAMDATYSWHSQYKHQDTSKQAV